MDTETYGLPEYSTRKDAALCPHMGRISLLQIKTRTSPTYIFDILVLEKQGLDWAMLTEAFASRATLVFANAQFDLKHLKQHTGCLFWNAACVITLSRLLGNATGSKLAKSRGHGLADLVRDYFDEHLEGKGSDSAQGSVWHVRPLDPKKLAYAAADVDYLIPLYDRIKGVLSRPLPTSENDDPSQVGWGMAGLVRLEMAMTTVAAEIEFNGLPASREMFDEIQTAVNKRLAIVGKRLCDLLKLEYDLCPYTGAVLLRKKSQAALNYPKTLVDLLNKNLGLSLDAAQSNVLQRLLMLMESMEFSENGDIESDPAFVRDERELFSELVELDKESHALNIEAINLLLEYKQLIKQQGMDLRKYINPVTGRIHCSFNTLGAATGRSSSARPNLQNVNAKIELLIERSLDIFQTSSSIF